MGLSHSLQVKYSEPRLCLRPSHLPPSKSCTPASMTTSLRWMLDQFWLQTQPACPEDGHLEHSSQQRSSQSARVPVLYCCGNRNVSQAAALQGFPAWDLSQVNRPTDDGKCQSWELKLDSNPLQGSPSVTTWAFIFLSSCSVFEAEQGIIWLPKSLSDLSLQDFTAERVSPR